MPRRKNLSQGVLLTGQFFGRLAGAQEDNALVGDRPDFTESAVGSFQVEAGATYSDTGTSDSESYDL